MNFDIIHNECRGGKMSKSLKEHKTVKGKDLIFYSNYKKKKVAECVRRTERKDIYSEKN